MPLEENDLESELGNVFYFDLEYERLGTTIFDRIGEENRKFLEDNGIVIEKLNLAERKIRYRILKRLSVDKYKVLTDYNTHKETYKLIKGFFIIYDNLDKSRERFKKTRAMNSDGDTENGKEI